MTYFIYIGDTCVGDVDDANTPDEAIEMYAERTNTATEGLTAIPKRTIALVSQSCPYDS